MDFYWSIFFSYMYFRGPKIIPRGEPKARANFFRKEAHKGATTVCTNLRIFLCFDLKLCDQREHSCGVLQQPIGDVHCETAATVNRQRHPIRIECRSFTVPKRSTKIPRGEQMAFSFFQHANELRQRPKNWKRGKGRNWQLKQHMLRRLLCNIPL